MKQAFIFDMDGVLIDSENEWIKLEEDFYPKLFGKELTEKIGNTIGISLDQIYQKACRFGFSMERAPFDAYWDKIAKKVYSTAPITENIDILGDYLIQNNIHLGIVSASKISWISYVIPRLSFKNNIEIVISLAERRDLEHKPHPAGYIAAMKSLGTTSENTFVLEDSNHGIQSAKSSGAFTIALRENLTPGYTHTIQADAYADTILQVIDILKNTMHNV